MSPSAHPSYLALYLAGGQTVTATGTETDLRRLAVKIRAIWANTAADPAIDVSHFFDTFTVNARLITHFQVFEES